jgi:FKBP-type peptidyl-prolyl cis-trans isomerase 2
MPGMDTLVLGSQVNKRVAAVVQPKDAYGVYTESKRVTFTGKLDPIIQLSTE